MLGKMMKKYYVFYLFFLKDLPILASYLVFGLKLVILIDGRSCFGTSSS